MFLFANAAVGLLIFTAEVVAVDLEVVSSGASCWRRIVFVICSSPDGGLSTLSDKTVFIRGAPLMCAMLRKNNLLKNHVCMTYIAFKIDILSVHANT